MMKKNASDEKGLKILKGGLSQTAADSKRVFHSAYVTDTRLMGVLGMRICWYLPDNLHFKYQYQFFYFDAEEFGFDRYESGLSPIVCKNYNQDPSVVIEHALSMFGGLGAKKREINEAQALAVLRHYARFNKVHSLPLPNPSAEYEDLLEKDCPLSGEDADALLNAICVTVRSPYEVANYFLMRSFGRDFSAASWLAAPDVECELFPELSQCTLCRNVSRPDAEEELLALGCVHFTCESLVESDKAYYIAVTRVTVDNLKVTEASPVSLAKISTEEAALILRRPEYVTSYALRVPPELIDRATCPLLMDSIISKYENNRLFSIYKPNNEHVNNRIYRLDNDLIGGCYLTETGSFVVFSGSLKSMEYMEREIDSSPLRIFMEPDGRFEFKENIMWEFISGGYSDLGEFLYDMDFFEDD